MSPRHSTLERRPVCAASRLATWLWALYQWAQPHRGRVPLDELLGRVRELIRVVESLLYLAPRDLELLARMGWELNKEVCFSVELAERQRDAWAGLSQLEDIDQAADVERRAGAVQLLSQLLKMGRVLHLHANQELREMASRWLVRDLHARRPCDELLQFCLELGVSRDEVLAKVQRLEVALEGMAQHA